MLCDVIDKVWRCVLGSDLNIDSVCSVRLLISLIEVLQLYIDGIIGDFSSKNIYFESDFQVCLYGRNKRIAVVVKSDSKLVIFWIFNGSQIDLLLLLLIALVKNIPLRNFIDEFGRIILFNMIIWSLTLFDFYIELNSALNWIL